MLSRFAKCYTTSTTNIVRGRMRSSSYFTKVKMSHLKKENCVFCYEHKLYKVGTVGSARFFTIFKIDYPYPCRFGNMVLHCTVLHLNVHCAIELCKQKTSAKINNSKKGSYTVHLLKSN